MPTVLVIDDNTQETNRILKEMEAKKYKVYLANTGGSGISSAIKNKPDIILLDLVLPDMTGFDVCRILRGNIKTSKIPIIILTVRETLQDKVDGFEAGASDYIIKPYHVKELYARILACLRVKEEIDKLICDHKEAKKLLRGVTKLAITDSLTGLFNRRYIDSILSQEFLRYERYGASFSLMMIDVDFLKQVNDLINHDAGDLVLREVSKILRSQIRDVDILARWGGDEFSMILPQSSCEDALSIGERILKAVSKHPFLDLKLEKPITVSIGVSGVPDLSVSHPFQLVSAADISLMRAKQKGRNQIDIATEKDIKPLIPIPS